MPVNSILRSTSVIAGNILRVSPIAGLNGGYGHHRFGRLPLASAWMKPKAAESLKGWKKRACSPDDDGNAQDLPLEGGRSGEMLPRLPLPRIKCAALSAG